MEAIKLKIIEYIKAGDKIKPEPFKEIRVHI
jgi:hypothetical protein